jgi:hypothetical protein
VLVLLKPNLAENSTKLASILTPWNKRLLNRQIVRLMELFRKPNDGRVLIREKGRFSVYLTPEVESRGGAVV